MEKYLKEYLEYKNTKNLQVVSSGSFKLCYTTPYINKVYLVSINKDVINLPIYKNASLKDCYKKIENQVNYNQLFLKHNINTPIVHGGFIESNRIVIVQEKCDGTPLFANSLKQIKTLLNLPPIYKISDKETNKIIFNYNLQSQNDLINLQQSHFDKLVLDLIKLYDVGFYFSDAHGANILVNKNNGFYFIDMPEEPNLKKDKLNLSKNCRVAKTALDVLTCIYHNDSDPIKLVDKNFYEHTYFKQHSDKTLKVLTKLAKAFTNNSIVLNTQESKHLTDFLKYRVSELHTNQALDIITKSVSAQKTKT